jgi:hypothetical protein
MVVTVKLPVVWDVTPWSLVQAYARFGDSLNYHGRSSTHCGVCQRGEIWWCVSCNVAPLLTVLLGFRLYGRTDSLKMPQACSFVASNTHDSDVIGVWGTGARNRMFKGDCDTLYWQRLTGVEWTERVLVNVEWNGLARKRSWVFIPATIILRKKMEYRLMRWEGDC